MAEPDLSRELGKLHIDRARKRPARRLWRWLAALAVLAAGGGAWLYYAAGHNAVMVTVVLAAADSNRDGPIPVLTAGGYIIPRKEVEVSSKIIGRIVEMDVVEGRKVKEGDVLLRIDDEEYQAQVDAATGQLAAAQARLAELQAGSRPEEIEAARAAVESAQATLDGRKQDLDRIEALAKERVVARQELDRTRTAYDVALAVLNEARKRYELVRKGPRREEIDAAEAAVRAAFGNLAYARTQLAYTVLRAPITGTILEKLADKGELVTNINFGGTRGAKSSVVTMADLTDLQVEIDLSENDVGKVRAGQRCQIRLDSHPDEPMDGKVDEIAPMADRQKATVRVKVAIERPRDFVRPEVNARVTFLRDPDPAERAVAERIWVPNAALLDRPGGKFVFIAQDGTAVARRVTVGGAGEKGVAVVAGLKGGERVIVEPLDKIADGTRIVESSS